MDPKQEFNLKILIFYFARSAEKFLRFYYRCGRKTKVGKLDFCQNKVSFRIFFEPSRASGKQEKEKLDCALSSRRMPRACPPSFSFSPVISNNNNNDNNNNNNNTNHNKKHNSPHQRCNGVSNPKHPSLLAL